MVIWGEQDPYLGSEWAEPLLDGCRTSVWSDCPTWGIGHRSTNRNVVNSLLLEFLERRPSVRQGRGWLRSCLPDRSLESPTALRGLALVFRAVKDWRLLAAGFGGTLAVLAIVFVLAEQLGLGGANPTPSPVALATATIRPVTPRPTPSVRPTPIVASASPSPSPSSEPESHGARPRARARAQAPARARSPSASRRSARAPVREERRISRPSHSGVVSG